MLSIGYIILITFFIESAALVVFNLVALYVTVKNKFTLNRRSFNELLLQVIFSSHVIVGTSNLVYSALVLSGISSEKLHFPLWVFIRDSAGAFAIVFTVLLSLDRFLAIRKLFLYQRLGKRHASLALGVTTFLLLGFCASLYVSKTAFFFGCSFVLLSGFFILASNALLYRSVRKQCEGIAQTIVVRSEKTQTQKRKDMRRLKLKSLKICIYITASYLLTWGPLAVYIVIDNILQINNLQLTLLSQIIGFSNGIWDALIYFYLNPRKSRVTVSTVTTLSRRDRASTTL